MCQEKRNQTMQSFNAELRLRHYLEHNQAPPEPNELLEHLEAEQNDQQLRRRGLDEAGEVALGLRASWIYRRRLNLSLAEHQLVDAPHDPVASVGKDFTRAWRNYLQLVFEAGHVFTVSLCPILLPVHRSKQDRRRKGAAARGRGASRSEAGHRLFREGAR